MKAKAERWQSPRRTRSGLRNRVGMARRSPARGPVEVLVGALLLLTLGSCTSSGGLQVTELELVWPADAPRVRLDRVLAPRSGAGGRLGRWLTGAKREVLLRRPYGVAWDGEELLLTDPGAGHVLRIGPRGEVLYSSTAELASPIGIATCPAGIVVTDSERGVVVLLGPDLKVVRRLGTGLARPTGVACAGGEIYVAETATHRVRVFSDAGERSFGRRGSAPGEFNFPTSLAVDGEALWVGDTLNFRVQRIDPSSGAPLEAFGRLGDTPGEMPRVKGLAVDGGGHLWVADAHLDAVSLFRRDGTYLMSIGRTGTDAGRFSFPAGVAAGPGGQVAVVDSFNRRVQIFGLVAPTHEDR